MANVHKMTRRLLLIVVMRFTTIIVVVMHDQLDMLGEMLNQLGLTLLTARDMRKITLRGGNGLPRK